MQQKYRIKLANAEDGPKIFQSVDTMADFILANQTPQAGFNAAGCLHSRQSAISAIGKTREENLEEPLRRVKPELVPSDILPQRMPVCFRQVK